MNEREKRFKKKAEEAAYDQKQRRIINHNIGRYEKAVEKGKDYFSDLSIARDKASAIKDYVIHNLDELLLKFEKNAGKNGMKVFWAAKKDEVLEVVSEIAEKHRSTLVMKTKSMISEELELNELFAEKGITSLETDLGEFIVQTAGEKPYHILTPAMHKSKEDVAELFSEKFAMEPNSSPEDVTNYVRDYLRQKFVASDLGVWGANFLLANTGGIALTENEGNGVMVASWPKTLIVIAGIEKIIPGIEDLEIYWPLVSVMGTGQHLTAYNSILSGPRKENEKDGPDNVYVILFDGGRSRIFEDTDNNIALKCIRCGACLNYCPVYKNVGGYTYDTVYTGPIGSVISSYLDDSRDSGFLNTASSLCGKCTEVCPVKIPLHELLLQNRTKLVEKGEIHPVEKVGMKYYLRLMLKRKRLNDMGAKWKNMGMNLLGMKLWGKRRSPLYFEKRSFNQRRRDLNRKGDTR